MGGISVLYGGYLKISHLNFVRRLRVFFVAYSLASYYTTTIPFESLPLRLFLNACLGLSNMYQLKLTDFPYSGQSMNRRPSPSISSVILTFCHEAHECYFGPDLLILSLGQMTKTTPELATPPPPSFCVTPVRGRLATTYDIV
ncbi:hypothetical protein AVEN_255098-1 [Araneus ventricosus]|uniref:Uncharacterized protein n=1 Tax=Araneus ventricosus TaxID=182803 RepID=A0A4Y2EH81_ARAVE|nr:hypothetical protein AVEN_255098-1 [Araneus ventricosus]